jgi:addiction module HigA family antidote
VKKLPNIHPGEILSEEFLKPLSITAYRLAKETHLSPTRISEIVRGKRGITADTALRFSRYFGNSADFWLGIQAEFDLREQQSRHRREIESIHPLVRDGIPA